MKSMFSLLVVTSILGFFVDSFNLAMFQAIRLESLKDILGTSDLNVLMTMGGYLFSTQMIGVMIGGFIWGPLSDRMGRVKCLKFAVLVYAIPTILNSWVQHIELYFLYRLLAGIGMAGEFGISVALLSESLSKKERGYAIVLVSSLGTLGFVLAGALEGVLTWREQYILGGCLGLGIVFLRIGLKESKVFLNSMKDKVDRGVLFFFSSRKRVIAFLRCVSLGLPTWFINAILVTFSYEIGVQKGIELSTAKGFLYCMPAAILGDLIMGALSQALKSRRLVMIVGLLLGLVTIFLALFVARTDIEFYLYTSLSLLFVNFWGVFITTTAEQFGTNVRSTATTLAPNFVRGAIILVTTTFTFWAVYAGALLSALYIGLIIFAIALLSLLFMKETSENNIDFNE